MNFNNNIHITLLLSHDCVYCHDFCVTKVLCAACLVTKHQLYVQCYGQS